MSATMLALLCTPLVVIALRVSRPIERWCYRTTYRWLTGDDPTD